MIGFSHIVIVDDFDNKSISSKVVGMKACVQQKINGKELECVNMKNSMSFSVTRSRDGA